MAQKLPSFPQPLPPSVKRFNADGTPTKAQLDYDAAMARFMAALAGMVSAG